MSWTNRSHGLTASLPGNLCAYLLFSYIDFLWMLPQPTNIHVSLTLILYLSSAWLSISLCSPVMEWQESAECSSLSDVIMPDVSWDSLQPTATLNRIKWIENGWMTWSLLTLHLLIYQMLLSKAMYCTSDFYTH